MRQKPGSNLVTNDIGTGIISSHYSLFISHDLGIQISKKISEKTEILQI